MTSTSLQSHTANPDTYCLSEYRTPEYHGEAVHTFGEGWNDEYSRHLNKAHGLGVSHEASVERRAVLRALGEQFGGNLYAPASREAALGVLQADLTLVVKAALGFNDRQVAEREIAFQNVSCAERAKPALDEFLKRMADVYDVPDSDFRPVVEKIAACIEKVGLEEMLEKLRGSPETFGKLRGIELPKDEDAPEGFSPSFRVPEFARLSIEQRRREKIGAVNSDRVKALESLSLWTHASFISTEKEPKFVSQWQAAEMLVPAYIENPTSVDAEAVVLVERMRANQERIVLSQKSHPGRSLFAEALSVAMESIVVKDLKTSGIDAETLWTAVRLYRNGLGSDEE